MNVSFLEGKSNSDDGWPLIGCRIKLLSKNLLTNCILFEGQLAVYQQMKYRQLGKFIFHFSKFVNSVSLNGLHSLAKKYQ